MSISLDVMIETTFINFIKQYELVKETSNPMDLLEEASKCYTNFSGNFNRLYDVVFEGEEVINNFSKEEDFLIYKLMKQDVLNIINKSNNPKLVEKWEFIMESFENYGMDENLYFIVEK
jgi:hypothetical protein